MWIDLSPLKKYRDFRLLFLGQTVSFLGAMVSYVAVPYQIYNLTQSTFWVGAMGIVQLVPVLVFGLLGGSIADRMDRRKLLLWAEVIMTLSSLGLAVNAALSQPSVVAIFVLAFVGAAAHSYHRPAMEAMNQKMVAREDYAAIGALGSLRYSTGAIVGPALGGWLISWAGPTGAYLFDVLTYGAAVAAIFMMRGTYSAEHPSAGGIESRSPLQDIREGLAFAWKSPALMGTYAVDIVAMTFAFPLALFPALGVQWGGAGATGWLYSGMAIGSLAVSLLSGRANAIAFRGRMVVMAAALWGVCIVGLGFAGSLPLALLCLIGAGAADMVSGLYRGIIWNEVIPNTMRGRLAGIEMISYMSGPLLGNFRAGTLASWTSPALSIWTGGVLCVVGVVLTARLLPLFWAYRSSSPNANFKP